MGRVTSHHPRTITSELVLATALAAGLAWMLGLLPSNAGGHIAGNALLLGLAAGLLGAVFLLSIGTAQWLVLRRSVANAHWWIVANALAWPVGVAVPVVALSLVPDHAPVLAWAVVGIASGMTMGTVVGAITGLFLVRMLSGDRRQPRQVKLAPIS